MANIAIKPISELIQNFTHHDPDHRIMSITDLNNQHLSTTNKIDEATEKKICAGIIKLLGNLSVICFINHDSQNV